jgi:hypothetical protein
MHYISMVFIDAGQRPIKAGALGEIYGVMVDLICRNKSVGQER